MKADPETEAEILELCSFGTRALDAGDIQGYLDTIADDDDVVLYGTGADEKILGRQAAAHRVVRQVDESTSSFVRVDWHSISLSDDGQVAWVAMDASTSALVDGQYLDFPIRFTGVLVRRDGKWLFVQQHSSIPGHPEGTSHPSTLDAVVTAIELERPDLLGSAGAGGIVAILFTDIENSTPMALRLGDVAWMETLRFHNAVVRRHTAHREGIEVKSQGDGFMLAFPDPQNALRCAIDIQAEFARYNDRHGDEPIRVRIGGHAGNAIQEDEDFFGETVIRASRVAAQARPGEVLISNTFRNLMLEGGGGDFRIGEGRTVALKGFNDEHFVYPVDCDT